MRQIELTTDDLILKTTKRKHRRVRRGQIKYLCFAVYEKGKSDRIGWCGLDSLRVPGQTAIFYIIDELYRRKGYATQCARKLISYAFEETNLQRVNGGCAKENHASRKIMENIGMILVGHEENGDPLFCIERRR